MAIAFDAASNASVGVSTTSLIWSHTVAASAVVFVTVGWSTPGTTITATYNGVSMTEVFRIKETTFNDLSSAGFFLNTAQAAGAHNVVVTFGTAAGVAGASATSWTGVDGNRTAFTAQGITTSAGGANSPSVDVTNAVSGDVVVDGVIAAGPTITCLQTSRATQLDMAGDGKTRGTSSADATGSTTMAWTVPSLDRVWAIGAMALIPAGGGAETITLDKWYAKLPDVMRRKIGVVPSGTIGIKA